MAAAGGAGDAAVRATATTSARAATTTDAKLIWEPFLGGAVKGRLKIPLFLADRSYGHGCFVTHRLALIDSPRTCATAAAAAAAYKVHLKPTDPAPSCTRPQARAVAAVAEREGAIHGERRRRVLAGGGDGGAQRCGGGHGVARQGGHGRRAGPAGARHPAAAHRRALPRAHRLPPGTRRPAPDDAPRPRPPLRERRARGGAAAVHDLRRAPLHHGHLRHRLLQRGPRAHLPARRRHPLRDARPPHGNGSRQARRHARLARRRHGAHLLQGRAAHPRPPRPLLCCCFFVVEPAVDAGHGGDPRQLRLPLLLVPPPRPARQEVPLRLLLQRPHVHLQLPPGRRRRPLRQAHPRRMAHHLQVPDSHRPLRRDRCLRRVLRAADVVHREARPGVRRRLHPRGADHRVRHRLHRPPRIPLPRKCAGVSVGDRWAVPAAVGQEAGGPAAASKSC